MTFKINMVTVVYRAPTGTLANYNKGISRKSLVTKIRKKQLQNKMKLKLHNYRKLCVCSIAKHRSLHVQYTNGSASSYSSA